MTHPLRHTRYLLVTLTLLALAGCNLSDGQGAIEAEAGQPCSGDGVSLDGLTCRSGTWIEASADMPTSNNTNSGPPDMPAGVDMGADMPASNNSTSNSCTPETNALFCLNNSAQCGTLTATDNCGMERTANCGTCRTGECLEDNSCSICQPETDEQFCIRLGVMCGEAEGFDLCGMNRVVENCGECVAPETCDAFTRTCRCINEPDVTFCQRLGAECGVTTGDDNCGMERSVNCGTCSPGECQEDNTCSECQERTDAELCIMNGLECGAPTVNDPCTDTPRELSCGTCNDGETCSQTMHVCVCPTPSCPTDACGLVFNACGNSIDCGGCGDGQTCDNNQCVACQPETDATFCARYSAECGSLTRTDNCGDSRTVMDCGGCNNDETCASNTCQPN